MYTESSIDQCAIGRAVTLKDDCLLIMGFSIVSLDNCLDHCSDMYSTPLPSLS